MRPTLRYGLALLLLAGCREGTSVLVRIDQGDVVIPTDVAAVHVSVTNPELSATATTFDSQVLPLCAAGAATGCYTLPLSVTLRPGDASPDALVRAEVIALDSQGNEVIHDAAEFHFDKGEHTTLDFYLSQACLSSTCATSNQLCGRSGGCVTGAPTSVSAAPDLATSSGTVTRFAENNSAGFVGTDSTWTLPKPVNAITGDLVIAAIANGVPPPGWVAVTSVEQGMRQLLYHRVGNGETDADYTFAASAGTTAYWLLALYRGVSAVVVGGIEGPPSTGTFDLPSFDAPRDHGLLTTWIASYSDAACQSNNVPAEFDAGVVALFETPVGAGPTGERTYQCELSAEPYYAAQILLVP